MARLRLALLGCGDVAQRDYLPEFHRLAGRAELVAVCARTPERARAVAAQYGVPAWYTGYARMLAEADIDAVLNLTPIQLHAETTLAALRAGKHVYTEKPLASTTAEARLLRDEAARRGRLLVCAPCVMLFPQVVWARSRLAEMGTVYLARGVAHMGVPPWSGYPSDPSPFFARGGGPAFDMGVYPLHALTGLLGPVQRVSALSSRTRRSFVPADGPAAGREIPLEVDDNWQITLDFGGACLAALDANSCAQATRAPMLELFGERGTLALNLLDVSAPVHIFRAGGDWEAEQLPRSGRASGPDHLLGVEHLVDCLERGEAPVLSADHALHVIDVLEQAAQASAEGQARAVATRF